MIKGIRNDMEMFLLRNYYLQIASVFLNGSCHSLARGNVTLSYRIGNDNQWKIIGEYASVGEYDTYVRTHTYIHLSMSVCVCMCMHAYLPLRLFY